ncbi:hypothetical protein B0H15DRAFT_801167 [Mycena belliarum]|uniref:Cyclin N-terminal domain-containing protein n=1 Tax=Mycena belliarum TaxID=1033014 RepID=A0AAD6XNP5_9AGAR|nr:hypothetical protein B0H15DRAFT_801167 [Mycena belliae]
MVSPASNPSSKWSPPTPSSPSSSTSSMSSTSSRLHPASLVDPARHSPALMQLSSLKISRPVVEYVVDAVATTVNAALSRPPAPRGRGPTRSPFHAPFTTFAANVLARAEVTPPVLLTALIYIARARPHLCIALEKWALERVFLGALITASKYTNDSALRNVHWALCSGVFGKRDVGRIEREFLDVLDWDLGVTEAQVEAQWGVLRSVVAAERPGRQHVREHTSSRLAPPRPRHARNPSMPELEPSSPSSSDASMSPRTPDLPMDVDSAASHSFHPAAYAESRAAYAHPASCAVSYPSYPSYHPSRPVPAPPAPPSQQKASASGSGLHDRLRTFPVPVPLPLPQPPAWTHPHPHHHARALRAAA